MRDKDGHVFKVVEERTVKPDDIPNIIKTGGIGIAADSDPIKALKKLQRLHELQEKQADEMMSMMFLLFFVAMLLSAYKRSVQARNAAAISADGSVPPMLARAMLRAAQADSQRGRQAAIEMMAKKKKEQEIQASNPQRARPPMYNPNTVDLTNQAAAHSSRGAADKNNNGHSSTALASKLARRKVNEGLNAVASAASGVKSRMMTSYRKAVKRGKKD
eukprot:CAMPEP_0197538120 /NCGR_PEP_ID=MMETSP1318-20131121/58865_1 /TAXON_ID=552666 /ORGANISM="Partenskyella glossopodia, Strain RCC365" /LENGTH=217 /DNA_ID=CAMNT_0043096453 /DNA_START=59 /DNA_END=712 /DNA_ORIENTATION=-